MFKYIILCLAIGVSGVFCNEFSERAGSKCEFENLDGVCVKESRCLTTLDAKSTKHSICSQEGDIKIVCCADCELVNDTSNVVVSPTGGMFWKTGEKARDNCLKYIQDKLPFQCVRDGSYGGIKRTLDPERKCHRHQIWALGGAPPRDQEPSSKFPYHATVGYYKNGREVWNAVGTIISDKYILTVAQINRIPGDVIIGVGASEYMNAPDWQIYKTKMVVFHPEYKRNQLTYDIALIETEIPIKFNKNVLPACLPVEPEINDDVIMAADWDIKKKADDKLEMIELEKFNDEECQTFYQKYNKTIDPKIQICYGSKTDLMKNCKLLSGEAAMINNQFTPCLNTIVGITSFGARCPKQDMMAEPPIIFTKISPFVPWIESIVWP